MKKLDLNKSIFELTKIYPELIDILKDIGFAGVKNPLLRKTVGKKMTIPEGCKKLGIDIDNVINTLKNYGFDTVESSKTTTT